MMGLTQGVIQLLLKPATTIWFLVNIIFNNSGDSNYAFEVTKVPGIFVKIGWSVYGFLERLIHHILPPAPSILVHAQSFMVSRCIYVVTILNIPDLIKNNPMRTSDLAEKVKVHPDRLERVMTLLHSHGIFKRNRQGKWCNNRLTSALRSDNPNSVKDMVEFLTGESYTAYEKLLDAVRDDEKPAFDLQFGESFWHHLNKEENQATRIRFSKAMISQSNIVNKSLLAEFDWSQFKGKTIVDVGGGLGSFSAELLKANPSLNLILFDLPKISQDASLHWRQHHADIINRASFVGGDFFKGVPKEGDVYFLRTILHDWSDEECVKILTAIHSSISSSRRTEVKILIADLEKTSSNPFVAHLDLQMMALVTGRERSREELNSLLRRSGFVVVKYVESRTGYLLTVAKPKMRK